MGKESSQEYITLPITMKIPYRWTAGYYLGRCLKELRDNARMVGNKCPKCGRIFFPPRVVCGRCHIRTGENWVEVGPKGNLVDFTIVYRPQINISTGKPRPEPYPHGVIMLDGTGGELFEAYLEETNPEKIKIGMRVEAVYKPPEERSGSPLDIKFFRTITEG